MPVMPALERLRQEAWEFKVILSYIMIRPPQLPETLSQKEKKILLLLQTYSSRAGQGL